MAVYRTIYTTFWTDAKIDDTFSPEDKYFYLYLMTNPHTNICGCYEISMKCLARELGYDPDTVRKLIKRMVEEHKVIEYNENTKEILIFNWYKYNWSNSKDLMKNVKNVAQQIKYEPFREYIYNLIDIKNVDPPKTVPRPSLDPVGTSVSVTVNNIPSSIKMINNINKESNVDSTIEQQEKTLDEQFAAFWKAYPKHTNTSKKKTKEKFERALKKTDLDTILSAIERQKKTRQWIEGYIPMATTWLNGEHWDDEIEEVDGRNKNDTGRNSENGRESKGAGDGDWEKYYSAY